MTTEELLAYLRRTGDVAIFDGGRVLHIVTGDGERYEVPALWLRDQCSCSRCRHPSGQRLYEVVDLALNTRVDFASIDGDETRLRFAPDGHTGRILLTALAERTGAGPRW